MQSNFSDFPIAICKIMTSITQNNWVDAIKLSEGEAKSGKASNHLLKQSDFSFNY